MASGFKSSKNSPAPKSKTLSIANANALTSQILSIFSEIEDPRVERNRVHLLTDIVIIAILSVIAGAKAWEDMENYGLSKYEWLKQFLKLPEGIPSADTFRRVFERINTKVFEQCFRRWVESIVENTGAQVIPIDGKTLKGLQFGAKVPGPAMAMDAVKMGFCYTDYFGTIPSTGYETLLYDCMIGDATLFQRADNVELGWSVVTPILEAWTTTSPENFPNYVAGSWGPSAADDLLMRDGRQWHKTDP